jgi:hypothetical protein
MKILFSVLNYSGSNIMLSRFLSHNKNEIKIAAYYKNNQHLNSIDWCLDSLYLGSRVDREYYFKKNFELLRGPKVLPYLADLIFDEVISWDPDLIITECEPFFSFLAKVLQKPLWYCSPMLLPFGPKHLYNKPTLYNLPKPNKYLVYSMFSFINCQDCPQLPNNNFIWVKPYINQHSKCENTGYVEISRIIPEGKVISGETDYISDYLYQDIEFVISPDPNEGDQFLNAQACYNLGIVPNIGQFSKIEYVNTELKLFRRRNFDIDLNKSKYLDEIIYDEFPTKSCI